MIFVLAYEFCLFYIRIKIKQSFNTINFLLASTHFQIACKRKILHLKLNNTL